MIRRIYSSLPSFKTLTFEPGLNILLADKSIGATKKQTRNSAGKSSFVDIVHFLMGGNNDPNGIFRKHELENAWFGIEFDLSDDKTVIERTGKTRTKNIVRDGNISLWPIKPDIARNEEADWVISNDNWKNVLGNMMFNLPISEEEVGAFGPTFRMLFSYFARRVPGGFETYEKHNGEQSIGDQQVAISYLLGLDWRISQEWQTVRKSESGLKAYKKTAKEEEFLNAVGSVAELRTQLTVSEQRARQLEQSLRSFKVLPEYRDLEREADELTKQLGVISDQNTIDQQLIRDYEEATDIERPPVLNNLYDLYREVGIILPDVVLRRFEDVQSFHQSVLDNRKLYLDSEMQNARVRIAERQATAQILESRYSEIMGILQPYGALDQYAKLQAELARLAAETVVIRQRFSEAEHYERRTIELELQKKQLELRLQQNFSEQREYLDQAILAFEEVSKRLYENHARLNIRASENGPLFEIIMQGDRSKGIKNMQIFAFDMMLMIILANRNIGPKFLIHDSHLFDGVDERQISIALEVGATLAQNFGFQYIVTMNSDVFPKEFGSYCLDVRLTDATETGGLFGFRFD